MSKERIEMSKELSSINHTAYLDIFESYVKKNRWKQTKIQLESFIDRVLRNGTSVNKERLAHLICNSKNKESFRGLVDYIATKDQDFANKVVRQYAGLDERSPQVAEKYFADANVSPEEVYRKQIERIEYQKDHPNSRMRRLEECLNFANQSKDPKLAGQQLAGQLEALIAVEREAKVFTEVTQGKALGLLRKGSDLERENAVKKGFKDLFLLSTSHQLDKLPELTVGGKDTFERLTKSCKDDDSFERHIKYLLDGRGSTELPLVVRIITNYTAETLAKGQKITSADAAKLQKAFSIAAQMGDHALMESMIDQCAAHCKQHGDSPLYGDSPLLTIRQDDQGQEVYNFKKFPDGKTILHHACQSNNALLVKYIADKMHEAQPSVNPFYELDDRINKLRPMHFLDASTASKLDSLYGLDGNDRGSFLSAVRFYNEAGKVVKQGFLAYVGGVAKKYPAAAALGGAAGKIIAGSLVSAASGSIESIHSSLARSMTSEIAVNGGGASALLTGAAIFSMAAQFGSKTWAKLSGKNTSSVNPFAGHSQLTPEEIRAKQQAAAADNLASIPRVNKKLHAKHFVKRLFRKDSDLKENNNLRLLDALEPSGKRSPSIDIFTAHAIAKKGSFKDIPKEVVDLLRQAHFPDDKMKKEIYKGLAAKATPDQLEDLMQQLAVSSPEGVMMAREVVSELIDQSGDPKTLQRATLIIAMLGDEVGLAKATQKLKDNTKGFNLVELGGKDDKNIMHYAAKSGNAKLIHGTMLEMQKESLTYPARCQENLANLTNDLASITTIRHPQKVIRLRKEIQSINRRLEASILDVRDKKGVSARETFIQDKQLSIALDEMHGIDVNSERGFARAHTDKKRDEAVRFRVKLALATTGKFIAAAIAGPHIASALVAMHGKVNYAIMGVAEAIMSVSAVGIGVAGGYSSDRLIYGALGKINDLRGVKPLEQFTALSEEKQKVMAENMQRVMRVIGEELKQKLGAIKTTDDLIKFLEKTKAYEQIGLSERDQKRVLDSAIRNIEECTKSDKRLNNDPNKVLDLMKGIMIASGHDVTAVSRVSQQEGLRDVPKAVDVSLERKHGLTVAIPGRDGSATGKSELPVSVMREATNVAGSLASIGVRVDNTRDGDAHQIANNGLRRVQPKKGRG